MIFKDILKEIKNLGNLELAQLESKISNELDLRFQTRTIRITSKEVRDVNQN
jgi:hypothetical protein